MKSMHAFRYVAKSKFLRSIFLRVLSVFLIVSIAVVVMVFFSFTAQIQKDIVADRQRQLGVIENSISKRMSELSSIAYNVGSDPTFYMEPVSGVKYTGYEMSNMLERYLTGNGFIEYLAYYRLSEPDKIYVSKGELSFTDFWCTYLGVSEDEAANYIRGIQSVKKTEITALSLGEEKGSFFAYTCPLPLFSAKPQAFVLMMIPMSEVSPLLETQFINGNGVIAVFDADGKEIYRLSAQGEDVPISAGDAVDGTRYVSSGSGKYIVQTRVSEENGWTYVSAIRQDDIFSGLAQRQLLFMLSLLALMFVGVFVMLVSIIARYRPINRLAETVTDGARGAVIDESALLADKFTQLKGDSEEKRRFETAYHEAEASSKAKSAFFSSMSHDIRTPMNAITGMTALALKYPEDADYVKECLQKVQVASRYLLDIINNVLDMSRIESGRFSLTNEEIDLAKMTLDIETIINQSVEAKRQRLIVDADIRHERVMGDGVRLMQVFMNILSNAVKFTPEGGEIRLSLRETDGEYTFSFSDTGIGMSAEFVKHVFDTFSRAQDADSSHVEGTGLGMAIARNLVELMGGVIQCQSAPGKGTTFTVTLRMTPTDAAKEEALDRCANTSVLIVCADEEARARQTRTFLNAGARVDEAPDASRVAEMARRAMEENRKYTLALIQQTQSDPAGANAAARIRAAAPDTPCVLAARDPAGVEQTEAHGKGVTGFVQTPLFHSVALRLLRGVYAQKAPDAARKGTPRLAGKRVLVAEDNAVNREIARRIIEETGAEIVTAEDGRMAADAFRDSAPGYFDVILMDLRMPVMDGYEAVALIRAMQRPDARTIPIYAMTANTFDEDVRQVREAGMNGHIGKPYTPETLYETLVHATDA